MCLVSPTTVHLLANTSGHCHCHCAYFSLIPHCDDSLLEVVLMQPFLDPDYNAKVFPFENTEMLSLQVCLCHIAIPLTLLNTIDYRQLQICAHVGVIIGRTPLLMFSFSSLIELL